MNKISSDKNSDKISIQAMAKINLGLDVLRRRENGYHDVKMIMQTVKLYDTLTFTRDHQPGIRITTDDVTIPTGEDNLIYKAADMMLSTYGIQEGVSIELKKQIPVAAGMAGGSTDAAAAFIGINKLFEINADVETLKKMAVNLGADIPYCIEGGTALSEGIGEVLTPLNNPPECFVVIVKPDIGVSTKYVYDNLNLNQVEKHPDIDAMMEAIKQGNLIELCEGMGNVLETVTIKAFPVIDDIKVLLKSKGALNSLMSGSGPTVFGIFGNKDVAKAAVKEVKNEFGDCRVFLTEFIEKSQIVIG